MMWPLAFRRGFLRGMAYLVGCLGLLSGAWVQWGNWPNPVVEEKLENVDLIVVLGGGAMERPGKAFELYERNISRDLLVTGDGDIIYNELLRLGVPRRRIVHEVKAHSTWENAAFSGNTAIFRAASRVVLVTTWFHGPRALAVFQKQYPKKTFLVAAEPAQYPLNRWVKSFRCRERYAVVYYQLRYGVYF